MKVIDDLPWEIPIAQGQLRIRASDNAIRVAFVGPNPARPPHGGCLARGSRGAFDEYDRSAGAGPRPAGECKVAAPGPDAESPRFARGARVGRLRPSRSRSWTRSLGSRRRHHSSVSAFRASSGERYAGRTRSEGSRPRPARVDRAGHTALGHSTSWLSSLAHQQVHRALSPTTQRARAIADGNRNRPREIVAANDFRRAIDTAAPSARARGRPLPPGTIVA